MNAFERARRDAMRFAYGRDGYAYAEGLLGAEECRSIVEVVERHRATLIDVDIDSWVARSKFFTINGEELEALVPAVRRLNEELCEVASELEGRPLAPLDNKTVGLSLNLTPGDGTLSWHYDRNLVTAVVHLNRVEGGEFEIYPRYRARVRNNHHGVRKVVQRVFDLALRPEPVRRVLGRKVIVRPEPGAVGFMDSRCLHQVAPVRGGTARAAIVFCYDEPGKVFSRDRTRNYYGYRDRRANVYG
ncbi:MAG: 2OG-Fe(II) oxygenase [Labilithrix sp.]|nr:2OG-Fe(II) oxygenase [Labilithrix sp.]